jgi:BirA family biotin operon repressor/biotin-[acetyl-CoA-carboxylase] ligase
MHLPASRAVAAHLDFVAETGSTNADLVARAAEGAPPFSVLVTTNQTAGRGRLGRRWVAPPGRTLAVSVLVPVDGVASDRLGWMPLAAGLAMTRAVASLVPDRTVALKWPNDVQIDGLKVSGILAELVPAASAIVVGAGLNLTLTAGDLPTSTATSLTLQGANPDQLLDAALAAFLGELFDVHARLVAYEFDADVAGVRADVIAWCATLGQEIRVELPGDRELLGVAEGIDALGRLLVRSGDELAVISAGDITHLRVRHA